jgi:hypothetical protein
MAGFDSKNYDQMRTLKSEAAITLAFLAETASTSNQTDEEIDGLKACKRIKAENREMRVTGDFPRKLLGILENELYREIISWQPDEESFVINNVTRLVSEVFPKHGLEFCSFSDLSRELLHWGFQKELQEDEKVAFSHDLFKRKDVFSMSYPQRPCLKTRDDTEGFGPEASPEGTTELRYHSISKLDPEQKPNYDINFADSERKTCDENEHESILLKQSQGSSRKTSRPRASDDASTSTMTHVPSNVHASLHRLVGIRQSPIFTLYNLSTQSNASLDIDTLTEILLRHHYEKFSLRTAILSDMLHCLERNKGHSRSGTPSEGSHREASTGSHMFDRGNAT